MAAYDSGMRTIQAYVHDDTVSYEHAAPLQTFSNGFAPLQTVPALHRRKRCRPRKFVPPPHPTSDLPTGFEHMSPPQPQPSAGVPAVQRRKPGRPRKYVPPPYPASGVPPVMPSPLPPPPPSVNATQRVRKRRVTAQGSTPTVTKRQRKVTAAGSSGVAGMNAEVITIQPGQDVVKKIKSLSGNGWAASILSAHGAVSNVTLRQGASSGDTVIYEGYFEIISLCGSYLPSETAGISSPTGGLSVSIGSLDGRIFAGAVAGPLTAASPVQVAIGRFPVAKKKKLNQAATRGIPGASSSKPRGGLNGSSGRPGIAPN